MGGAMTQGGAGQLGRLRAGRGPWWVPGSSEPSCPALKAFPHLGAGGSLTRRVQLPKEARSGPRSWQGAGAGVRGGSGPCPESWGASSLIGQDQPNQPRTRLTSRWPRKDGVGGLGPLWLSLRKKVHVVLE